MYAVAVSPAAPPAASGTLAPSFSRRLNALAAVNPLPAYVNPRDARSINRWMCGGTGRPLNIGHAPPFPGISGLPGRSAVGGFTQYRWPLRALKMVMPAPTAATTRPPYHGTRPSGPGSPGAKMLPFSDCHISSRPRRSIPSTSAADSPKDRAPDSSVSSARSNRLFSPLSPSTTASGGNPATSIVRSVAAPLTVRA